jgi:hypothetical protein
MLSERDSRGVEWGLPQIVSNVAPPTAKGCRSDVSLYQSDLLSTGMSNEQAEAAQRDKRREKRDRFEFSRRQSPPPAPVQF